MNECGRKRAIIKKDNTPHRICIAILLSLFFLTASSKVFAADATLSWNANTETDLAGYKVYVGTVSRSYGTPIVLGKQTSYTVTNLGIGTYFFSVTAFDTSGNESGFSSEASKSFTGNTPPVISSVAVSGITTSGATITWITSQAATSQVAYGLTTAYGSLSALNTTGVTSHSRTLSGLLSGMAYNYRIISTNATGNTATSGNFTFTTTSAPDTTPPVLSAITATGVTVSGAIITWMTNEAASSQVAYGLTVDYGSFSALNTSGVTSHSRTLSGLSSGTVYNYRIISTDAAGNTATSGNFSFTTPSALDTTPPVLSAISASGINGGTQALITWVTNETATSQVAYGLTTAYGNISAHNMTGVTNHSRTLSGLTPGTSYNYLVISTDAAGNTATSANFSFTTSSAPDTTPPVLSAITASGIGSTEATIRWSTNEAANARVEYGTAPSYGYVSPLNNTPATQHTRTLFDLIPATTYHFRVISNDAAGNVATSANFTFVTTAAANTIGPLISSVAITQITPDSALIVWGTDVAADGQIAYGTTPSYGRLSILNQTLSNSHTQRLDSLQSNTRYHFQIISADAQGNRSISNGHTLTAGLQLDSSPPDDVLNFAAISGLRNIALKWINPSDPDFVGVRIAFRTDRFPNDLQDGTLLGDFTGRANETVEASHVGLENGTTYYYIAASYDGAGNFQTTVQATATTLQPNNQKGETTSGGGGCGMIFPNDGNPPGPGQSADLIGLFGIVLILLLTREMKRYRFGNRARCGRALS